jgi:hypothetical protein
LKVLADNFLGQMWNEENQINFQISLIQNRLYGHNEENGFSQQFLNGLSDSAKEIFTDYSYRLTFQEAKTIFEAKNYKDPPMRGRQSFNPFRKFGFIKLNKKILEITPLGNKFLSGDYDLSEIFFRSFLKWQIPNPDSSDYKLVHGYDIKPFIGVLHLIKKVNEISLTLGEKVKGISKIEFSLFCPTLVNYNDINPYAEKIISLRQKLKGEDRLLQKSILDEYKIAFAEEFLDSNDSCVVAKLLKNLDDYGDNAIRYFRLTRYLYIHGGGFYIDLEPRRAIEINALLNFDDAKSKSFSSISEYSDYFSDIAQPKLPWETIDTLHIIVANLIEDAKTLAKELGIDVRKFVDFTQLDEVSIKNLINELRSYRRELQDRKNNKKSQEIDEIKKYITELTNIFSANNKPVLLEKLLSLGLNALNDAIKIKPNYPVGDDNEPTFTAPGNIPDIECFYENFNAICEVTMLSSRDQWYNEGQPVMRHLRDFEIKYQGKQAYCLFIAPKLHRDTINTFWYSIKYEYEGAKQKIIPLSISSFILILNTLIEVKQSGNFFSHSTLSSLYDEILTKAYSLNDSNEWVSKIPNSINEWRMKLGISI